MPTRARARAPARAEALVGSNKDTTSESNPQCIPAPWRTYTIKLFLRKKVRNSLIFNAPETSLYRVMHVTLQDI